MITMTAPPDNLVIQFPITGALIPINPPIKIPIPDNISPQATKKAVKSAKGMPFEASQSTNPC